MPYNSHLSFFFLCCLFHSSWIGEMCFSFPILPPGRTKCGIFRMPLKCNKISRNDFRNLFVCNYHSAFHTAPEGDSLLKDLTWWWTTSIYSTPSVCRENIYPAQQPQHGCWDSTKENQWWHSWVGFYFLFFLCHLLVFLSSKIPE